MFLLALAILIITVLLFKGLKFLNYIDHVAGIMEMIPGPTPYPFVGNLFQFGLKPDEYPKKILQYCRKYEFQGFRSLVFFQYHIMLSDPTEIKKMLSSSILLYKEHLYSFLRPWLGDGLLTSSGARWLKHHKIYLPAFEKSAIDGYMKVVHQNGQKFVTNLTEYAQDKGHFDIQNLVQKCTLDIVCENATGITSDTLNGEPTPLHIAITELCQVIQERTFSIVKRFDTLFQLTSLYWTQQRALRTLKKEINKIVEQRQQMVRNSLLPNDQPSTFLDFLMNAKLDGRPLKAREIFEELSTFIFTGHDPTASAVSFTLFTLSRHPEVQEKVYKELIQILSDNQTEIDTAQLDKMEYLEMVIRETLRLYPSVPLIARTNRKPIVINETKIAKRTTVIMCLIAMGYNEKYFDKPCEFRPERFRNFKHDNITNDGIDAFKSVPFSAGPRRCIAEKFAMYKVKTLVAMIVHKFKLLPPIDGLSSGINDYSYEDCVPQSEFDPILNIRVTLKSENGITIRLRERINVK